MTALERMIKKYEGMLESGYETIFISTVLQDLRNIKSIRVKKR